MRKPLAIKNGGIRGRILINCLYSNKQICAIGRGTFSGYYGMEEGGRMQQNTFAGQSNWWKTNWWKIKFSHTQKCCANWNAIGGKADYWKTLWLHFVRSYLPSPSENGEYENLMQSPRPKLFLLVCVCVCVTHVRLAESLSMSAFTECLPKRPRTVVPWMGAMSRPAPSSCSSVPLGVRCNDVLVCSATLAIKYKYAIKQTRTGRAGHMHYYIQYSASCPQFLEIFARKRRHKLENMAHLASREKKCAQWGGGGGGGGTAGRVQQNQDKGDSKCFGSMLRACSVAEEEEEQHNVYVASYSTKLRE